MALKIPVQHLEQTERCLFVGAGGVLAAGPRVLDCALESLSPRGVCSCPAGGRHSHALRRLDETLARTGEAPRFRIGVAVEAEGRELDKR